MFYSGQIRVGDTLKIKPFRKFKGFVGVVTHNFYNGNFNIKDQEGKEWCRSVGEIDYKLSLSDLIALSN